MTTLFLRTYSIIADAVERGINSGTYRAHKHDRKPSQDIVKDAIYSAVMHELTEVIEFDKYEINDTLEETEKND